MSSWAKSKPSGGGKGPGILEKIPGYSGYRAKESRRDEDKRVRLELAREYDLIAQRLTDVQGELVRAQRFAEIGNVERMERSLRLFTDRLRTATYGYGGLFSDRSIDERALDQIAAFDRALGDGVDELSAAVEKISAATLGAGDDLPQQIRATQGQIDALNRRFDLRSQAIDSGQAVSGGDAPDVFAAPQAEQAHVADDLHFGDAVSISGADYIVKGRMEFHSGDTAWRQYLLRDTDEEHWLHVPPSTAEPMALLTKTDETPGEGNQVTVGGQTYSHAASGAANVEVVGESGKQERMATYRRFAGDSGALLFAYNWGDQQQTLAGRTLDPLEIKVYAA